MPSTQFVNQPEDKNGCFSHRSVSWLLMENSLLVLRMALAVSDTAKTHQIGRSVLYIALLLQ